MEPDDNELVEKRLYQIEKDLYEIRETLNAIKETMVNTQAIVKRVGDEVMPTVNALVESPMLKMFLPKQKAKK